MKLIDNHCHLQHKDYKNQIHDILKTIEDKMDFVVVSGANMEWNQKSLKFSQNHKIIYSTLGIHPVDAVKTPEKEFSQNLKWIEENLKNKKVIGIGEIGLDYHWFQNPDSIKIQKNTFISQLKLSKKHNLPVIIHSRKAELDALEIMEQQKIKRAVMHCFAGKKPALKKALDLNYYISISTNILFSKDIKKIARDTPLDKIIIETDSPYLSPEKGKLNYPWNTELVLNKISQIKKTPPEEILTQIKQNIENIYHLKLFPSI